MGPCGIWEVTESILANAETNENLPVRNKPMTPILGTASETQSRPRMGVLDGARILIICDDKTTTELLETLFGQAGFTLETARSFTAACERACSGRFGAVISVPLLSDGSWRRLIDLANHYDLGFEVVLLARNFDLSQWAEALEHGAFDVLDAVCELSRAAEVVKSALWAAYLKGAVLVPRSGPQRQLDQ
jgi:DNA-binding NtrC family response regulator